MMEVEHIEEYSVEDPKMYSDAIREILIVDGEEVLNGDWYHHKIGSQIEGYLKALQRDRNIVVKHTKRLTEDY
jgi:hypothetical protein